MIVGIDLGTTHSLIGAYSEQGSTLFRNALGDHLTPSVVSVDGDTVLVGQAARDRLISHPHHSVASFKRWMGTARETRLGERSFRPEELSALVLRSLLADAEAALGEKIAEAVISVPAYFSDAQRKATRTAGELAGIRVERLINEPTAAALAYGLQSREEESRFLVFDLGGGTFDVSILECFDNVFEVHASAGDNFLGGEDFLDVLVEAFCQDRSLRRQALSPQEYGQLRRRLELLKRDIGGTAGAPMQIAIDGREHAWEIDEERFARLCEPLVQRMRTPIERAMRDAKLQPAQLNEIVLVGGASRMPLVARLVSRMFGRLPLRHVNPDQAIALGASVAAGLKSRDAKLEEIILTDVCPYTLGTQIARRDHTGQVHTGYFHPIILRNSTVPVSREDQFYPMNEQQQKLVIDIYQGENPLVANNIKLGEISMDLDKRRGSDQNGVTVRFTYDINGLLQVEVTEHATQRRHELLLEQNPGLMTPEEIRARLAALAELKVHPRDQQENIAVLARAERLYEEHLHERARLQEWIVQFRAVVDTQDAALIVRNRDQFAEALDALESLTSNPASMSWALRKLGLDADADERAVKRAYAARLKTIRPETDPEGFQALNETYQAALEWLRERPATPETSTVEPFAASNATPSGYASVKLHFEGVQISMPPFRNARRDENPPTDFDEQDFFFTVLQQSEQLDPQAFKHWLERNEALYSMPLKAALAEPLVWFLRDQPPLTREHLAITLAFFGLDTVNDTTMRLQEPLHHLHQTAQRSGTDWEEIMSNPQRIGPSNAYQDSGGSRVPFWFIAFSFLALARCVGSGST